MSNIYFIGGAPARKDVWTVTLANTWAANDIAKLTIANKTLQVTVNSAVLATIAEELANAVNGASADDATAGWTWNYGGQEIPEFREVTAEWVSGATFTITGVTAGVPVTITAAETTAGDGTCTISNTTVATGPEHLDNAANYAAGALPVDNDTLYFVRGAVSAKYGLTYFRTNSIDLHVVISNDWMGQLGLPNNNASGGYQEYRQRYFQFRGVSKSLRIEPGLGGNTNVGKLWIDLQDQTGVTITVSANRGNSTATPTIYLCGADAATFTNQLHLLKGAVVVEPDDAPTDSSKYAAFSEIHVGTSNGADSDAILTIGRNALLYLSGVFEQSSGQVIAYATTSDSGANQVNCVIRGGTFTTINVNAGQYGEFEIHSGGALKPVDGIISDEIRLFGGTLDCRGASTGDGVLSALKVYAGSSIYDPNGEFVSAIDFVGCRPSDLAALVLPVNRLFDLSANATP